MRKKRVMLHSMTFKRDFGFVYCLSKILERLNCEVYVCSNTDYLGWPLSLWKPDVIFFVTMGRMERIAKKFPNAELVLWNTESCRLDMDDPVEIQVAENPSFYKRMRKVLLWGQGAKDIILNKAKDKNWTWITEDLETFNRKFIVVGHPRLDLGKYGKCDKKNKDTVRIGIIGVCAVLNNIKHSAPELLLDAYQPENIKPEKKIGTCQFDAKFLGLLAKTMHELGHEKYEYNIRPYFLENIDNYQVASVVKTGKLVIDDSIEFSSWVKNQDIIIGSVSTTMFLVAASEISYINVDVLLEKPQSVFSEQYLAAIPKYCPKTYKEFMDMILNYKNMKLTFESSEILSKQREHYLSSDDEFPVLFQMAQAITDVPVSSSLLNFRLPGKLCFFLNAIRTRYAEFRGLKRGQSFDYSHFDRYIAIPKAEKEFSAVIEEVLVSSGINID